MSEKNTPHLEEPDWVRDAIFYQIFPDRFNRSPQALQIHGLESWDSMPTTFGFKGGDLYGIKDRLGYIRDLGCNALYLNPVFSSTANHRYHTVDYLNVDPILGGNAALRSLLDSAHESGMRVILDGVFNHCGRGFYQFNHTLENGKSSPYRDWFYFNTTWLDAGRSLNPYPGSTEQGAAAGDLDTYGYRCWWGIPALPKFNTDNAEVREFLWSIAEHWIRFGIDGWRLDVPNEINCDDFWRTFRRRVRALNGEAYLVGEIWDDAHRWLQGDQFDGVMNYPLARAVLGFFFRHTLNHDEISRCGYQSINPINGTQCAAELTRVNSMYGESVSLSQFNILGTHDTPRVLALGQGDEAGARMAFLCLFTMPGAPCIYYGDEIGMTGDHDPDCRRSMEWDQNLWRGDMLDFVKACTRMRSSSAALRRGTFRVILAEENFLAYERLHDNGDVAIVCFNVSDHQRQVSVPITLLGLQSRELHNPIDERTAMVEFDGTCESESQALLITKVAPRSGQVWISR